MTAFARLRETARRHDLAAFLFLAPTLIIIFGFHLLPILFTFGLSLFHWDLLTAPRPAGGANFHRLALDPLFWKSIRNTIYYTAVSVPAGIVASLTVALLLNQKIRGVGIYRTIYFIPVITSISAVSIVWKGIYHPNYGLLNQLLAVFGLPPQRWLLDPRWALLAIIGMSVWKGLGYNVILFLAGLKNIPQHLYEAAQVDGARRWHRFRHITWPLLSPITFFVLVMSVIGSFQVFAQIYMMTPGGGPQDSTTTVVFYLYKVGFGDFHFGYASAIAFELFVLIFALTFIQRRVGERRVHYQ